MTEGSRAGRPGVDAERILREARDLAFPRYPGTEGDRRAIERLRGRLAEAGLEVAEEEFSYDLRPAWRALRTVLVGSGLMVGAAGWTAPHRPGVAAVLVVLAVAVGGVVLAWTPWAERLYRRPGPTRTANVVGRRRAAEPRLVLVLMAHHDSKSQNLSLPWRLGLTLGAVAGSLTLVALALAGWLGPGLPGPPWLAPAAGSLAAASLLALATLRNENRSPGAVDNAGSVAVLLELARVLPDLLPADVESVFLSTGAEEDHMVGAMRWLDRHRPERLPCPVYTINLDGVGNPGPLILLERYGFGRAFSPTLSRLARRAARRLDLPVRGILVPPGLGLDTIPFAHRGLESITLSSGSLNRATLGVHSPRDVADHLDGESLGRAARLAAALALEVAVPPAPAGGP